MSWLDQGPAPDPDPNDMDPLVGLEPSDTVCWFRITRLTADLCVIYRLHSQYRQQNCRFLKFFWGF